MRRARFIRVRMAEDRVSAHRFDNLLTYRVDSRSRPEVQHAVDLGEWGGNGSCTCEHFQFRLAPHLRIGAPPQDALRCDHIMEARQRLVDDVIVRILAKEVVR
jgi:hypothetical protein